MLKKRIRMKQNGENFSAKKLKAERSDEEMSDEDCFKPIEKDGESVLAIECGPNKAYLYLSKLYQGSKGSCVSFQGSWLTPNEFQFVSGRESAKDWKRSIRHQGLSLKSLFTRGILSVRKLRQTEENISTKPSGIKDTTNHATGLRSRKVKKRGKHRRIIKKLTIKARELDDLDVVVSAAKKSDECQEGNIEKEQNEQDLTSDPETETDECDKVNNDLEEGKTVTETTLDNSNNQTEAINDEDEAEVSMEHTSETMCEEIKDELEKAKETGTENGDTCCGSDDANNSLMPVLSKEVNTEDVKPASHISVEMKTPVLDTLAPTSDERESPPRLDYCSSVKEADEADTSQGSINWSETPSKCICDADDKINAKALSPKSPQSSLTIKQQHYPCSSLTANVLRTLTPSKTESPSDSPPIFSYRSKPTVTNIDLNASPLPSKEAQPRLNSADPSTNDKVEASVKAAALNSLISTLHMSVAKQHNNSKMEMQTRQYSERSVKLHTDSKKDTPSHPMQYLSDNRSYVHAGSLKNNTSKKLSLLSDKSVLNAANEDLAHCKSSVVENQTSIRAVPPDRARGKIDSKCSRINLEEPQKSRSVSTSKLPIDQDLRGFANGIYLSDCHALHSKMQKDYNEYMALLASAYRQPFPFFPVPVTGPSLPEMYSYSKLQENRAHTSSPLAKDMVPVHPIPPYSLDYSHLFNPFPGFTPRLPFGVPPYSAIYPMPANSQPEKTTNNQAEKLAKETKSVHKVTKLEQKEQNAVLDLSKKNLARIDRVERVFDYSKPLDFSKNGDKTKDISKMDLKWNSEETYVHKRHRSPNVSSSWIENSKSVPKTNVVVSCKCRSKYSDDIRKWTVDQVCHFLSRLDGCAVYAKTFREQGITGVLLPALTIEQLTRSLGMKIGPSLFLKQAVEKQMLESESSLSCKHCNGNGVVDIQRRIRTERDQHV